MNDCPLILVLVFGAGMSETVGYVHSYHHDHFTDNSDYTFMLILSPLLILYIMTVILKVKLHIGALAPLYWIFTRRREKKVFDIPLEVED